MLFMAGLTLAGGGAVVWGMSGFRRAAPGGKLVRLLAILVGLLMLAASAAVFAGVARFASNAQVYTYQEGPAPAAPAR